jgi:Domain of unknown function (DUF4333)
MHSKNIAVLAVLTTCLTAPIGCSFGVASSDDETADRHELETEVASILESRSGAAPREVDCPDALTIEVEARTTCTWAKESVDAEYLVQVQVTEIDGDEASFDVMPMATPAQLEDNVVNALEGIGVVSPSVECEEGVVLRNDAEQRCVVTDSEGTEYGLTATMSDVQGNEEGDFTFRIDVKVDEEPLG